MKDIVAVALVLGFFALCVAYVGWCDRIVGTDDPAAPDAATPVDSSAASPAASSTPADAGAADHAPAPAERIGADR